MYVNIFSVFRLSHGFYNCLHTHRSVWSAMCTFGFARYRTQYHRGLAIFNAIITCMLPTVVGITTINVCVGESTIILRFGTQHFWSVRRSLYNNMNLNFKHWETLIENDVLWCAWNETGQQMSYPHACAMRVASHTSFCVKCFLSLSSVCVCVCLCFWNMKMYRMLHNFCLFNVIWTSTFKNMSEKAK